MGSPSPKRTRLPLLGGSRLPFERRLHATLWALLSPLPLIAAITLVRAGVRPAYTAIAILALLLILWSIEFALAARLLRPLQTIANVLVAMRAGDFALRVRGGRRNDALGDLAIEVNALANDLQRQRISALESAALVRNVLASLDVPVFALDLNDTLQLVNPAARRLLPPAPIGRPVSALVIAPVLAASDGDIVTLATTGKPLQWQVRCSSIRLGGVPHKLILLSDVSHALRDEEKQAWQRLIRVMGHEINNSLTPIKSLAGSLRTMLARQSLASQTFDPSDFDKPLAVIEDRAESLNRFLSAYRQLAQIPPPARRNIHLGELLQHVAALETRIPVRLEPGPDLLCNLDPDQFAQALINLVRNAAEATLLTTTYPAEVLLRWQVINNMLQLSVLDQGPGIGNPGNLFVPFYTTKEHGTGLGLILVKEIIEAHQGSVVLRNRLDTPGAEALLILPVLTL
jgi:two-component system nitrogen regulation sensor histidine kinase NtrY